MRLLPCLPIVIVGTVAVILWVLRQISITESTRARCARCSAPHPAAQACPPWDLLPAEYAAADDFELWRAELTQEQQ
ncbi:MAG TPA: hypothetical protein VLW50_19720 [Streptosporangiaceae bacterium]|nr:hypothetical protein [Streptosporangiaceae bacterium]